MLNNYILTMQTQLFIGSNIFLKNMFIRAIDKRKVDYIEIVESSYANFSNDSSNESLKSYVKSNYNRIGFAWENSYSYIPFGYTLYIYDNHKYQYFSKELVEFLMEYNKLNVPITVDLITCSLTDPIFIDEVNRLKQILENIIIEYSFNSTGSVICSDWIMESSGVNIKNMYFNRLIDLYKFNLGSNYAFNSMITRDGDLYLCGYNLNGQLGLGYSSAYEPTFKEVVNWVPALECESNVTSIACGSQFLAAINNGSLYMCGFNNDLSTNSNYSLLGLTNYDPFVTTFTKVTMGLPQDKKVIAVACGFDYTMAVMRDGSLYACGMNDALIGQLGLGLNVDTVISTFTKVPLPDGLKVIAVSCGIISTAIICYDEKSCLTYLYTCGDNSYGQLGLGDLINRSSFVQVTTGIPQNISVFAVSCGFFYTGVLLNDGILYTTGDNTEGQLGNGNNIEQTTFAPAISGLPSDKYVIGVSCSADFTDVILEDGSLYVCGDNAYGVFGQGGTTDYSNDPAFRKVTFYECNNKVIAISTNLFVNSIIMSDGTMYTAGLNNSGLLGQGIQDTSFISSMFNKVSCIIDQNEEKDTRAVSLSDWNYIFFINNKPLNDLKLHNLKKCLTITSNYQNYKLYINNKEISKLCFKTILKKNLFKKCHDYVVKLINCYGNVILEFKLCF
jgi:alpha-tubulin suppressor-like RCC1 family protein